MKYHLQEKTTLCTSLAIARGNLLGELGKTLDVEIDDDSSETTRQFHTGRYPPPESITILSVLHSGLYFFVNSYEVDLLGTTIQMRE